MLNHQRYLSRFWLSAQKQNQRKSLLTFCGFKDLRNFTLKHINPLLESGQLEMTIPDKPKSRNRKYITVHSE
ncbi:MAG: Fic family protein [Mediterraneibacter gnavus]